MTFSSKLVNPCLHRHRSPDTAKTCAHRRNAKGPSGELITYAYDDVSACWRSCKYTGRQREEVAAR